MQPCHNLSRTLGPGQINFVTESPQQALTDLLNPNYCLELRQSFDLDINLCKTDASLLASTIYTGLRFQPAPGRVGVILREMRVWHWDIESLSRGNQDKWGLRDICISLVTGDCVTIMSRAPSRCHTCHECQGPGGLMMVSSSHITHSAHDTDDTALNSCQPPVIFIDSRALHKHI